MAEAPSSAGQPKTFVKWGAVLLAVAGFAGIAVFLGPSEDGPSDLPAELADEPDAYLEDGIIIQFRDDGTLHYRLRAERISHFDREGRSTLRAPILELHAANRPPWRMESRTGEVRTVRGPSGKDEEQVALHGDVALTQDRNGGAFTKVRTESLVLFPGRQQAQTDQTAMIETETLSVRAAGFEADLARGRLELHSSTDQRVSILVRPDQQTAAVR